jgi:hypothetical protein
MPKIFERMTMKNNIVPGYPYEGAFYWLLSAEDWRDSSIKSSYEGSHPYYKTLYGKRPGEFVDETASLCVMYEKIILAPADCYMPDYRTYLSGDRYDNQSLGVLSDWDWVPKDEEIEPILINLISSIRKRNILSRVPDNAIRQIVRGVIVQLRIAVEYDADIIGNASYQHLCRLVQNELLNYQEVNVIDPDSTLSLDLKLAFSLAGLHFSLQNLDEFVALRESTTVRLYGKNFRRTIEELPISSSRERLLLQSMLDVMNSADLAEKIAGGLDIAGTGAGYLSLIPGIGTAVGIASLCGDHASRGLELWRKNRMWWMLGPEISKTFNIKRLEHRYKELGG